MIWTFILGVIASWAAPALEERLQPLASKYVPGKALTPIESRTLALAMALLIAALVATFTGSGHVLPLTLGALIGVLGPRLYDKFRDMRAPDYDS